MKDVLKASHLKYLKICTKSDKHRVKKIKFGTECDSHWGGKNNRKLNFFIKTMVHRSNLHYSKINQKRNWKNIDSFLWNNNKKNPPRQVILLCIWKSGLGILEIDTQLNSMLKTKWLLNSKIIKPHQSILERFIMHWLNLIFKSNQGWVLRQRQILRSPRYENLQKQSNDDFFYTVA